MKLATYSASPGSASIMGALVATPAGERLLDLHGVCEALLEGTEVAQARAALGGDLMQFVRNGAQALGVARELLFSAEKYTEIHSLQGFVFLRIITCV